MKSDKYTTNPSRFHRKAVSQVIKLYRAEGVMLDIGEPGGSDCIPGMSLVQCQNYLNQVVRSAYVRQRFVFKEKIIVSDGRGMDCGLATIDAAGHAIIRLPKFTRHQYYLLHELTHHLIGLKGGHRQPEFARTLLRLVKAEMGQQSYDLLKKSYNKNKVEFTGRSQ